MLTPKKTIPSLAVPMLALTGCAGDGGNGGNGLSAALEAWCMKFVDECNYTLPMVSTAEECVGFVTDVVLPYYNLDPDCQAVATYIECSSQLTCQELVADRNSRDDEWYAALGMCVFAVPRRDREG